jgi:hypothetical protein
VIQNTLPPVAAVVDIIQVVAVREFAVADAGVPPVAVDLDLDLACARRLGLAEQFDLAGLAGVVVAAPGITAFGVGAGRAADNCATPDTDRCTDDS